MTDALDGAQVIASVVPIAIPSFHERNEAAIKEATEHLRVAIARAASDAGRVVDWDSFQPYECSTSEVEQHRQDFAKAGLRFSALRLMRATASTNTM